ncbi:MULTISPECIES: adenylate/guanylate cyclase domain-containing protein [unclassified Novosphingobium]|uniref:adenylate/guanylate cyclase domain-containing protein n=1 Tax=unclassified Novosphingobium TaxID=2644732 RepID=UPI0025D4B810|nr:MULTISPECIES: adenylate/guanylate cyclase domain-containing protein [unclassified Novosphingobium]HQV03038.1 adenylate/guanylate cyclase domain-containing protein [Novosphingobium sp.]
MFLDISDFTSRPSETEGEQEVTVRCLSFFFGEIVRIIEDYGGSVEKNTGDGVMAYFSRRSGPGDPRKRAVACAMTMFYAAENFINPAISASNASPLAFRICIDFGFVTIARMGAAQRFNHIVAVGATANRTSKMLRFANSGDLMIGQEMLGGLPREWLQSHVRTATSQTGWTYPDGSPYPLYLFDGRWVRPI